MVNDTLKWSIGRGILRMKCSLNECFVSLYLELGVMVVKKMVDSSCIIFLCIQWIDMEHRRSASRMKD
jgi:hypothetical protein